MFFITEKVVMVPSAPKRGRGGWAGVGAGKHIPLLQAGSR